MPTFAATSRQVSLPRPSATAPQIYSVPRLSGGYDYYQAPPGSSPALGNDYPVPNVSHPNPIGISSLHVGREMPPGCRLVGSGERAVGSVTAMPGAGGDIPNLGAMGEFTLSPETAGMMKYVALAAGMVLAFAAVRAMKD
jgi:hypothetical protein